METDIVTLKMALRMDIDSPGAIQGIAKVSAFEEDAAKHPKRFAVVTS